jgi:hypothetical protein
MTGSKVAQMIDSGNIGEELIHRGWRQGSLLKAMSAWKMYLVLKPSQEVVQEEKETTHISKPQERWELQQETLDEDDYLVVVSQTCDIERPPKHEPYVEVVRAYWTTERSIIHEAGKNSFRRFLLQRRTNGGKEEALIADATVRILVEKASLLKCTPLSGFKENDTIAPRRFRQWLAKRYDRPALPDELVLAVQKPIVKAIGKLQTTDALHDILDGISQMLFLPPINMLPYQIELLFIREERSGFPVVSIEDTAKLAGWIADVLKKGGNAGLSHWELLSLKEISAYDYANAYELSLDQYSLLLDEKDE